MLELCHASLGQERGAESPAYPCAGVVPEAPLVPYPGLLASCAAGPLSAEALPLGAALGTVGTAHWRLSGTQAACRQAFSTPVLSPRVLATSLCEALVLESSAEWLRRILCVHVTGCPGPACLVSGYWLESELAQKSRLDLKEAVFQRKVQVGYSSCSRLLGALRPRGTRGPLQPRPNWQNQDLWPNRMASLCRPGSPVPRP